MKMGSFLSGSHAAAAIVGVAACLVAAPIGLPALLSLPVAAALAAGLGLLVARRFQRALESVDKVAAGGNELQDEPTGIWDVDQLAERVRQFAHRWAEAVSSSRRQSREVQQLLAQLDQRSGGGTADRHESASLQLRRLLGDISGSTDENLQEIISHSRQAERAAQSIAAGADEQHEALSKTTTYVEQMSADFDAVSQNANVAQHSAGEARELSAAAQRTLDDLQQETGRLRLQVETAERKLRALGERSQEIGSIVQMIGSISSRTDLLALNASIESYRGGEQGRGFSVVAEEVRKLAEQTAQATREVTALIESIQLETQESILAMAEQRAHVETEADQVRAAGDQLARVSDACSRSSQHIDDILRAAGHQLRLTQGLVTNVEQLSDGARQNRSRAEEINWTLRSVSDIVRKIGGGLVPLRRCAGREASPALTAAVGFDGPALDGSSVAAANESKADEYMADESKADEYNPALSSVDAATSLVNQTLETE